MTKPKPSDSFRDRTIVSRAEASSMLSLPLYLSASLDLSDMSEYLTFESFFLNQIESVRKLTCRIGCIVMLLLLLLLNWRRLNVELTATLWVPIAAQCQPDDALARRIHHEVDDVAMGQARHQVPVNGNQHIAPVHLPVFMSRAAFVNLINLNKYF